MVIDTSAPMVILKVEPEAMAFVSCLVQPGPKWISAATLLERRIVAEWQLGAAAQAELDLLLTRAQSTSLPLEKLHVHWALAGWRRYGKGRQPVALNFGDCFSDGLARALPAPLLCKGDDFAATDLEPALPP